MMRCESFEKIVLDLDRPGALAVALRAEALDHASGCPRCSRSLLAGRALDADLHALADATRAGEAAPAPPGSLLAAVRERGSGRRAPRMLMAVAATAALLLVGLLAGTYLRRERRGAEVQPRVTAEVTSEGRFTGYTLLGYAESLDDLDGALVVRVELTNASLAGLGFGGAAGSDPVRADLIVGEDGIARAIRLVE